tara:strand:+ start:19585 stop:20061 length:477 start_codon:yes stop_codon:yes gene_type:complete
MSLYASKQAVEITMQLFTTVHQCKYCSKWFTELENVGCWDCIYHPGKFDHVTERYECCGAKRRRPLFNYSYGHMMTWKSKDRWNHMTQISEGCTRRDCMSKEDTPIPKHCVKVDDIATLIPYMKRPLKDRPGLKKGPLRLDRGEKRPYACWTQPPSYG